MQFDITNYSRLTAPTSLVVVKRLAANRAAVEGTALPKQREEKDVQD